MTFNASSALAAVLLPVLAPGAQASCGSAFCTLLNDRFALGTWEHVGWSVDTHLELVTQDRLRSGTRTLTASDVTDDDAIERRTRNRNLVTTVERAFDEHWSLALRVPIVQRDHVHDLLDAETGAVGPTQHWRFTRVGDVQALGRYQGAWAEQGLQWALLAGLKLPTGSRDVVNAEGERAERALQPGTGTTDLVIGASARWLVSGSDALSVQATLTDALDRSEQFKPGGRAEESLGWSHAWSPMWSSVLQFNLAHRRRDSGAQAEPDNSGSTTVSTSPGVSVALTARDTAYLFVQRPLYQHVNGIQLVPRTSWIAGWTHTF